MANLVEVFLLQLYKQLQYKIEANILKNWVGMADTED